MGEKRVVVVGLGVSASGGGEGRGGVKCPPKRSLEHSRPPTSISGKVDLHNKT